MSEDYDPFESIPDAPLWHVDPIDGEDINAAARDQTNLLGRVKKKKETNHTPRVLKLMEDEGYFAFNAEGKKDCGPHGVVKVDFLGLFDVLGMKLGAKPIGGQICHKSDMGKRFTKMTSTKITIYNNRRHIDNLLMWLKCGNRAIIFGAEKIGVWWELSKREITLAEVEKALGRKRS